MQQTGSDDFAALLDTLPVMAWLTDDRGMLVFCNRSWLDFTGRSLDGVVGRGWERTVAPDHLDEVLGRFDEAFQERRLFEMVYPMVRADGETRWVHERAAPRYGTDGRLLGYVGATLDISDRRRREEEHRADQRVLAGILDNLPVILFRLDADGTFTDSRGRGLERLGLEEGQVVGADALELYPQAREQLQRVLAGEIRSWETAGEADGEPWLFVTHGFPDPDTGGMTGIALDITPQIGRREEQRRLEQRMLHSQKLESLALLAGGVAHDFNNLLGGILGNAELALSHLPEEGSERSRDYIERVRATSRRAAEVARRLLAYSGRGHVEARPMDTAACAREMTRLLRSTLPSGAELTVRAPDDLPSVAGDPVQVRQLVLNLVVNAAEALEDGQGTIEIEFSRQSVDDLNPLSCWTGRNLDPGEYVCMEVRDDGTGMTEDTLERLFDPFYTTKGAGRGLGLAAVIGIVRGHGGGVRIESRPGEGTRFRVLLPADGRPPVVSPAESEADDDWRGSGRVLLADDDAVVRAVAREVLTGAGLEVETATDGRDALTRFRACPDEWLCVVLDLTMPHVDGRRALEYMREVRPDLPAVLCTGYEAAAARPGDAPEPHEVVLTKPYTAARLLGGVRRVTEDDGGA